MDYKEITCDVCGKPILKNDKRYKDEMGEIIHDYCKYTSRR